MINEARTRFSRREVFLGLGALSLSLPLAAIAPPLLSAQEAQVSKEEVKYQNAPMDGKQCSGCVHFAAPNSCRRVKGEISPQGWCVLHTPKPG